MTGRHMKEFHSKIEVSQPVPSFLNDEGTLIKMNERPSEITPRPLNPERRWDVFSSDPGFWRTGLYRPENTCPEEITELEKHSCPELFICLGGKAGLVVIDGPVERIVTFEPGDELLVTGYHNGFIIDQDAYFLVVERTFFTTEYIDRKTRLQTRQVTTK